MVPAGQGLHLVEAVAKDVGLIGGKDLDPHVGIGVFAHALEDGPVEAVHAFVAHHAGALHHDVIAGFGVEVMFVGAREHHVVTDDQAVEEQFGIVARRGVETAAGLHPVVAFVAQQEVGAVAAQDEIVAFTAEDLGRVDAKHDEILAVATHQDVCAVRGGDHVVAVLALEEISFIARVEDDVVAAAAVHEVDAEPGLDEVVAVVAPDAVIPVAGDDRVGLVGATHDNMLATGETDVIRFHLGGGGVVADHLAHAERFEDRVVAHGIVDELVRLIYLKHEVVKPEGVDADVMRDDVVGRSADTVSTGIGQAGVGQKHLGERVLFELVEEVLTLGPRQVVEAVAILQRLHLRLEDCGKGRSQHAAEGHDAFRQSAHPEVDAVQTA